MSEASTLFAMVGTVYFTVRALDTARLSFAAVAGFLAGWAGMLRGVPLAAVVPAVCVLYLTGSSQKKWLMLSVTGITAAIVFLSPIFWFWKVSGLPMLSNSVGFHIFTRVVTEQHLIDKTGPATKQLLTLLDGKDPGSTPFWELAERGRFRELGYQGQEALLRKVALEGIRMDPMAYLSYSLPLGGQVLLANPFEWIPAWGDTPSSSPSLENAPPVAITASSIGTRWSLQDIHRAIWPILCWFAGAGAFLGFLVYRSHRWIILAFAWAPAGYVLSSACIGYFNARFNMPTVPFVAPLAMIPIALALEWRTARNNLFSQIPKVGGKSAMNSVRHWAGYILAFVVIGCSLIMVMCKQADDPSAGRSQGPTASEPTATAITPATWELKVHDGNAATLTSSIDPQGREVLTVRIAKASTRIGSSFGPASNMRSPSGHALEINAVSP
jgi:hypothetical protein